MFLPLLNRYPCTDLYVSLTGFHGLWCPANHRLFQLVCIFIFSIYSIQVHVKRTVRHIEVNDWINVFRLGSNPEIAKQVSADVVTKRETLTIADIFSYMKQESAKVKIKLYTSYSVWNTKIFISNAYKISQDAFFECTATIDDVVHGSAWYYIGCSGCHAKATKGATSLVCTNTKCEKINTAGVPQYGLSPEHLIILSLLFASVYYIGDVSFWIFFNMYRAKISVYDNSDQAVFVLLGDAGRVLTGRHASELVSSYFEVNIHQLILSYNFISHCSFFFSFLIKSHTVLLKL